MIASAAISLILLVTDQPGSLKANEVANLFETVEPFSRMPNLKVKIVEVSSEELGCDVSRRLTLGSASASLDAHSVDHDVILSSIEGEHRRTHAFDTDQKLPPTCKGDPPDRLIDCGTPTAKKFLADAQSAYKARHVIVVKELSRYGGSGGKFPVITTASPAMMAIHELMHQLGFADEYAYTTDCEADLYCADGAHDDARNPSGYGSLPGVSYNVPRFNAQESYSSNASVRRQHGSLIPWLAKLDPSANLISNQRLGSPSTERFGLHRGVTCEKASERTDTWRLENAPNVMSSLKTSYIPTFYWKTIAESLGVKID
ncbi:MAG: hypothetical protein V4692_08145 [Bdellovibrionota bacterium]